MQCQNAALNHLKSTTEYIQFSSWIKDRHLIILEMPGMVHGTQLHHIICIKITYSNLSKIDLLNQDDQRHVYKLQTMLRQLLMV